MNIIKTQEIETVKKIANIVPYEKVNKFRMQPDIIPPTQKNYHEGLGWVKGLFKKTLYNVGSFL